MPKLSFNKITNYLIFLTLSLFAATCLFIFAVMIVGRFQGDNPNPMIPWTTLQVGFVLIVVPFFGKRIFAKVVNAPEEVTLPRPASLFVGMLSGLLYGGAILILATAALFCTDPARLLGDDVAKTAFIILGVTAVIGMFLAPQRVSRKARLWLLVALIAQFVSISTARQLLGLYPMEYDYKVEELDLKKMPLADRNHTRWLIPEGAKNIHIHGVRASFGKVQCTVSMEQVKKFMDQYKLKILLDNGNEIVFGNDEFVVFIYNQQTKVLAGSFRRDGLPENLKKPQVPAQDKQ